MSGAEGFTLADLAATVAERASSDDPNSYTASLMRKGQPVAAKKLGEEAVETVIAAVEGDPARLTSEAADLLYHLLVVLEIGRVPLADVMAELRRRTAQTGLQEKAARKPG